MTTLKDRAMLVKFTDHVWQGGLIDKDASRKVEKDAGAQKGTGHYWKRLVPKAAMKARINIGAAARNFHNSNTSPWMNDGVRVLPAANWDAYSTQMRKYIAEGETIDAKFISEYSQWVDEARRTQGSLFNAAHYPKPEDLLRKFGMEIDVLPLPNIADWRVDLGDEQVSALRKAAEDKFNAILNDGLTELYERLTERLKLFKLALDDKDKTFRDSLVKNIRAECALLAKLNITENKDFEAIRAEVEKEIAAIDPNALRFDHAVRGAAAQKAGAIMSRMAVFMGKK